MLKAARATFLLAVLVTQADMAVADDIYRVRFNDKLDSVAVEACFAGEVPRQLQRSREAGKFVLALSAGTRALDLHPGGDEVALPGLPPDSCVSWEVDLAGAAKHLDHRHVLRSADYVLTRADLWFWQAAGRDPPRIVVTLPPGGSISAPWTELPSSGDDRMFRPAPTPLSWTSRVAVGRFRSTEVPVPGTSLRLAILGAAGEEQAQMLEHWIEVSARSVAGVMGRFPQHRPQVLVIAVGPQSGPVPWAHVIRGGGVAAEFFVDPRRGAAEFANDWTATHELSHMLLPYVSGRDRWLSEGLASYYQNVLRARDGRLTEIEAWRKLHAGFQRGQVETGVTASRPSRNPDTMRTYWGGAAMMLRADAELRALSRGAQSLDTALAALHDGYLDAGRRWTARSLLKELDRQTGFSVFTDLLSAFERSGEFPEVGKLYAQLGLVPDGSSLEIDADAPWGRIRHFIMSSHPASGAASH